MFSSSKDKKYENIYNCVLLTGLRRKMSMTSIRITETLEACFNVSFNVKMGLNILNKKKTRPGGLN